MSELLIDSATDESKINSPIKATQQESSEEVVYLSRTRKGTMRSKMVIDKINGIKMKLGSGTITTRRKCFSWAAPDGTSDASRTKPNNRSANHISVRWRDNPGSM